MTSCDVMSHAHACIVSHILSSERTSRLPACPSVRPSVRPSVTVRYHVKITSATITRSLLEDCPVTPVVIVADVHLKIGRRYQAQLLSNCFVASVPSLSYVCCASARIWEVTGVRSLWVDKWFVLTELSSSAVWFLQRVSIAYYAKRCTVLAIVNPSVCPSHAGTVSKWLMLQSRGLRSWRIASPHDSSFLMVNFTAKFQRGHRQRGANETGVGKIRNFHPTTRRISEKVRDSYNDGLIGSRTRAFFGTKIIDLGWAWTADTRCNAEKMRRLEPTAKIWMISAAKI